jgi:DNA-binding protein H-NS
MSLKSLKVEALIDLRNKVDAVLSSKVADERRALEAELAKLTRYDTGRTRSKSAGRGVKGKVAPKYRNLENPAETWAGRGLKPRWLAAATKSGKSLDDFNIATKKAKRARRGSIARKKAAAAGPHGPGGGPGD